MTWSSFILLIAVLYGGYYLIIILLDFLNSGNKSQEAVQEVYSIDGEFAEDIEEEKVKSVESNNGSFHQKELINNNDKQFKKEEQEREKEVTKEVHAIKAIDTTVQPDPISGGLDYEQLVEALRQKAVKSSAKHSFG